MRTCPRQHPYCLQRKPPIEVFSKKLAFQKPRGKALNHNLKLMPINRPDLKIGGIDLTRQVRGKDKSCPPRHTGRR